MGRSKKKKVSHHRPHHAHDEEVDFETLVKEEFKKLHRQYRLMEDARHAIAGASGKLSKQGKLLERLREEKEDLLTDLKNARCRAYREKDKASIRTILEALERYEKYKQDITACILSITEMESNVDRITQRLVEQKLKVQALYGQSMTVPQAEHRKRILENRLYHVTTQFDTLVSQNKELKQEINMMLKLRGNFYRRMLAIKKLSAKIKTRMGEVVYEATAAYDQRDEWVNKINILRERNDKDSKQHVLEIKEFQRVLHHDSKIHEFLAIKNKDRDQLENATQRNDRKNQVKISELDALLAAYKKSFRAILRMAKSRDIESLVNTYLEEEQKNYAVFKFITDLNHEANSLQDDIIKIKAEIEKLAQISKDTAKSREEILSALDKQLELETQRLEDTVNKLSAAEKALESFGKILDRTFSQAGCSDDMIIGMLGNQMGMKAHNICFVMKVVEHRTTELIFEKGFLEVRKSVEIDGNPLPKKPALWVQGQKPPPQGGPYKPQVHITGRLDAEQEEDDNETKAWQERPMYYAEMRESLLGKDALPPAAAPTEDDLSAAGSLMDMDVGDDSTDYPSVFAKSMRSRDERLEHQAAQQKYAEEFGEEEEDEDEDEDHTEPSEVGGDDDSEVDEEVSPYPPPPKPAPPPPATEESGEEEEPPEEDGTEKAPTDEAPADEEPSEDAPAEDAPADEEPSEDAETEEEPPPEEDEGEEDEGDETEDEG